jgi:hypothetical protein
MKCYKKKLLLFLAITFASLTFTPFVNVQKSSALSGGEFQANRIMDDGVFYNAGTMRAQDVQNFLNAKVPACDTNGTQPISSGSSQTRAQWAAANSKPAPPYTCLRNFSQTVGGMAADSYCNGTVSAGTKSAAQIIKDVSVACSINPQVLLVLLQKEQSLITDDWPWPRQYDGATGYACPDTAACDPAYAGFFNQVYYGARQYQRYARQADLFNYRAGQASFVAYSPNSACSGTNLGISDQATAGLYNYTPYQPNAAALNNLYGTGDSCSAYGNRNFWRMFNDWFGSPIGCPQIDSTKIYRLHSISTGDYLYSQNSGEICQATKYYGYTIDGPALEPIANTDPGAISLYRLSRRGIHFYTTNTAERDSAMSAYGYAYEGVAYYISGSSTTSTPYPTYRLSNMGTFFYTVSALEKDMMINSGFSYQGIAYYSNSSSSKVPVYRLSKNGIHLYTSSDVEKAMAVGLSGYSDESTAFYAQSGPTGDDLTDFRMERSGRHFYTIAYTESIQGAMANYRQETSGVYVYNPNYPGTVPVYRLSSARTGDYLFTTSAAEKDAAISQYGYRYEGVGFNASTP